MIRNLPVQVPSFKIVFDIVCMSYRAFGFYKNNKYAYFSVVTTTILQTNRGTLKQTGHLWRHAALPFYRNIKFKKVLFNFSRNYTSFDRNIEIPYMKLIFVNFKQETQTT